MNEEARHFMFTSMAQSFFCRCSHFEFVKSSSSGVKDYLEHESTKCNDVTSIYAVIYQSVIKTNVYCEGDNWFSLEGFQNTSFFRSTFSHGLLRVRTILWVMASGGLAHCCNGSIWYISYQIELDMKKTLPTMFVTKTFWNNLLVPALRPVQISKSTGISDCMDCSNNVRSK